MGPHPYAGRTRLSATDLVLIAQRSPLEFVVNSKETHTGDCRLKSWLQSYSTPCAVQMCPGRRKGSTPQQAGFSSRPDPSTKSSSFLLLLKCTVFILTDLPPLLLYQLLPSFKSWSGGLFWGPRTGDFTPTGPTPWPTLI